MPKRSDINKVLVIGSGPIVIGQAAEFDYAGAQACRVLKDAGVNVVLCNSNPATIMTDKAMADEIYLEPLTVNTVKRIIEKERPDSLLASLGGQTGLTIAMQLAKDGYLDKMGIKLLGTNVEAIDKSEDRKLFKQTMEKLGQPVIPSDIATNLWQAVDIAEKIGYPVIIRPAFTLGGAGGGVAYDKEQLKEIASSGLMLSPISQILVEKYIYGWKEIEFEVLRDGAGNVLTVCSMENFDPVGVHTGDSIVIAPAVTLSDKEYQMLRTASLDIITELGIEGGCNCQFALNPDSFEYAVIEVNPRVSRSSALASKATGYPIAKVASKIALGYTLDEIKNDVTGKTFASFEPTIDYVVIKLPKWPFDKFVYAKRDLGTRMKATGEVMAIGNCFEAAIMKAVRGAEINLNTLNLDKYKGKNILEELKRVDDERLFTVFEAIKQGVSADKIFEITKIDRWFINKLKNLADYEKSIAGKKLTEEEYLEGKRLGYIDSALKKISGQDLPCKKYASYKMVDTCGAEFAAETPYFYSTYDEYDEAKDFVGKTDKKRIIVFGSGPIRIGQGIEFDYSSVHCVWTLKELGYEVIIINNNPETVSTDFDTADRLYFEPLTPEDVENVLNIEKPYGVVVTFGGQTAIKLTKYLDKAGVNILGTSADSVDMAEDRERFDALLEKFDIRRPKGLTVMNKKEALKAANTLGFPVLLRPSYVIGGQNMTIAFTENDIERYMDIILEQKIENPVLCDKYMMGIELEVDVICDGEDVLIPGIMEHIERAGVHSGDSIAVYPPYNLNDIMLDKLVDCSTKLTLSMKTKGLINIQFLIYQNELYVIEVNPRASRTIPYISKVTGVPMVELATRIMVGEKLAGMGYGTGLYKNSPYFAVKVPVFSYEKLNDVNAQLGPEMKSTGEVLGIGKTMEEALFKGLLSAGFKMNAHTYNKRAGIYMTVNEQDKFEIVKLAKKFSDLGLKLYATKGTAETIATLGIDAEVVDRLSSSDQLLKLMESGKVDYILYTGKTDLESINSYIKLQRQAILLGITVLTSLDTANALADIFASRFNEFNTELVDLNNMRTRRTRIKFYKMQSCGNDYIFFDNMDEQITCPESLAINFADRHYGIGGDGIVLMEKSKVADCRMRIFNQDGSEGEMAGNSIRCLGKYIYDKKIKRKETITVETKSGIRELKLIIFNGEVSSVAVEMGKPSFKAASIPTTLEGDKIIDREVSFGGEAYKINLVSVGNPHCVIFCDRVDTVDLPKVGGMIEHSEYFPERINTEFVRVVNKSTLKMRVWERGNGETLACGTGAVAAVVAAVENGYCNKNEDITVKLAGGDLLVNYSNDALYLTGSVSLVFEGEVIF